MAEMEIWVPEMVVVLFLALPLLRPFVKVLGRLDGLNWLPLVGLGIIAGIFPAYGFRFECLPMLLFTVVYNLVRIVSRPTDSLYEQGPLLTLCAFILLCAAAVPMFAFAPQVYTGSGLETEPVTMIRLPPADSGMGATGGHYTVRIYGAAGSPDTVHIRRPVIFVIPPELGSAASVNLVCTELSEKGYTVVTYSRHGYDISEKLASPARVLSYWRIFRKAADSVSVNEQGKVLEAERRIDIEYLLPQIPALLNDTDQASDAPPLVLVGYGAGGSALAYLAGEAGFGTNYGNVLGVAAIESRLWSAYTPEHRDRFKAPVIRSKFTHQLADFIKEVNRKLPQYLTRKGPLPDTGLPLLYLLSGQALDTAQQKKPYQAVFDSLRMGNGPVALVALEGAGPLDYQDFPYTHPIFSFFLPGFKGADKSENPISDTAAIIGSFASLLLERAGTGYYIPPRTAINGSLYIESKGIPEFSL